MCKFIVERGGSAASKNVQNKTPYDVTDSHVIRQYLLPLQLQQERETYGTADPTQLMYAAGSYASQQQPGYPTTTGYENQQYVQPTPIPTYSDASVPPQPSMADGISAPLTPLINPVQMQTPSYSTPRVTTPGTTSSSTPRLIQAGEESSYFLSSSTQECSLCDR